MKVSSKLKIIVAVTLIAALTFIVPTFPIKAEQSENPLSLLLGLNETAGADIANEYRLGKKEQAAYGTVYKFTQYVGEYSVPEGEIVVCVDKAGDILSVFGHYQEVNEQQAKITTEQAVELVEGKVDSLKKIYYCGEPAYEINTDFRGGYKYVVSALNGQILFASPQEKEFNVTMRDAYGEDIEVELEQIGSNYRLSDTTRNISVLDAKNGYPIDHDEATYYESTGTDFEDMAEYAFINVIRSYDFYADANNIGVSRMGINGNNDTIAGNMREREESVIYILMHYGEQWENAACVYLKNENTALLQVGDGNANNIIYQPGKARDVLAHEYQHAITNDIVEFSNFNTEGAINESISDIFGALVEGFDPSDDRFWRVGQDVTTRYLSDLRDMRGGTKNQAYNMAERVPNCTNTSYSHNHEDCDHGGVHLNSTILTHAQYLMYRRLPSFFTRETIGTLWYNTLLTLSGNNLTTFDEFAMKMYQAARNLGYNDEQLDAVRYGLKEVGLDPSYTVTFLDKDGNVIETQKVPYGGDAVCPEVPNIPVDDDYVLVFKGWSVEPKGVTADMTIRAEYEQKQRWYSVKFYDYAGSLIEEKIVEYDSDAVCPTAPVKPSDDDYVYIFTGWDLEPKGVTADMKVTAQYEQKQRWYNVDFVDNDGKSVGSITVEYGETLSLPTPDSMQGMGEDYDFVGWYLDEARSQQATNSTVIEADMTIYGKWVKKAEEPNDPSEEPKDSSGCASCGTITTTGGGGGSLLAGLTITLLGAIGLVLAPKRKKQ